MERNSTGEQLKKTRVELFAEDKEARHNYLGVNRTNWIAYSPGTNIKFRIYNCPMDIGLHKGQIIWVDAEEYAKFEENGEIGANFLKL